MRPEACKNRSLDRNVRGVHVERLEHDLRRALSVLFGFQRSFRERKRVLFRRNPDFVVERVMPDVLHVVPNRHDVVLDEQSGQTQQHRSHRGWRVRPRRSPARVRSEVATPQRATHISSKTPFAYRSTFSRLLPHPIQFFKISEILARYGFWRVEVIHRFGCFDFLDPPQGACGILRLRANLCSEIPYGRRINSARPANFPRRISEER